MPDDLLPLSDKAFAKQMDAAIDKEIRLKAFEDWCKAKFGATEVGKYVAYLANTHTGNLDVEEITWNAIGKAYWQVENGKFKYRDCGFTAYVKTIAENEFYSSVRQRKPEALTLENDEFVQTIDDTLSMDEVLILQEELAEILKPLTERRRQVLILHYIQDRKHAEIAVILGISEDLVRQECSRAVKQLRKISNKVKE
jgi:RNA polymerase sigma factor (sigma-70 family)